MIGNRVPQKTPRSTKLCGSESVNAVLGSGGYLTQRRIENAWVGGVSWWDRKGGALGGGSQFFNAMSVNSTLISTSERAQGMTDRSDRWMGGGGWVG